MNRSKLYRMTLFLILSLLFVWFILRVLYAEKDDVPWVVSVIVDDSNNDRWIALKQGLEQAASDFNVKLNIVSNGEFTDVQEELAVMRRELGNGVDGMIVQMVSSEGVQEELEGMLPEKTLVLLETDIVPEEYYVCVASDNPGIGKAIAECVAEDLGEDLSGIRIGILSGNQRQLAQQQRLESFAERIEETGASILWELDKESSKKLAVFMEERPVDVLIALENTETERAVDYLEGAEAEAKRCMLYGEGISEKAVYYLDKGAIRCLVVPNEYYMGYKSVASMVKKLQHSLEEERSPVDYLVVDKDSMYDMDNEKILFPSIQ